MARRLILSELVWGTALCCGCASHDVDVARARASGVAVSEDTAHVEFERRIQAAVVRHEAELGNNITSAQVTVEVKENPVALGCWVFHAAWGAGHDERFFSGLVRDDDLPDTYPARALTKIFDRWIESDGRLPDAATVASVAAYILDAGGRKAVIFSEGDASRLISQSAWRSVVTPPEVSQIDDDHALVSWWWVDPRGQPSKLRLEHQARRVVRFSEADVRELVDGT